MMSRCWYAILTGAILVLPSSEASALAPLKADEAAEAEQKSVVDFKGMGFGVGIGFSRDVETGHVVQQAQVINGTIRATEQRSDIPRIVLETHYFWVAGKNNRVGWGPFVAVQSGSGEIIESIGPGLMFGLRRTKVQFKVEKAADGKEKAGEAKVDTDSFNLGVGALLDNRAKVLRDGLSENGPIPPGEEGSPLIQETSRWSLVVLFSFSF